MIADPTRAAALTRLKDFVPHAGATYAMRRNFDLPDHPYVSVLSPYIRHRVITEAEVLRAVLEAHSFEQAEKFISEVYWRTYWKGWLERRPAVWHWYQADLQAAYNRIQTEAGLRQSWAAACNGETGIACFDHWAQELGSTGYLHNHARMWFASIWIFTLKLPWVLGADFFLRHLLDGDPASNTLSWRWVGGLQTKGKTYLTTAENIAKYTDGRFNPSGLAAHATALSGPDVPAAADMPQSDRIDPARRTGLLVTVEDLSPQFVTASHAVAATAVLTSQMESGPLMTASGVSQFRQDLLADACPGAPVIATPNELIQWAKNNGISQIVTAYAPVGPTRDWLDQAQDRCRENQITLALKMRAFDQAAWPHATKGFFPFRKQIPTLISSLARH